MEMFRVFSLWDTSCAYQLPPLVELESENTAFVLADSEGEGPVKEEGVHQTKEYWLDCGERSSSNTATGALPGARPRKHPIVALEATREAGHVGQLPLED